jgi:two-component system, response regulator PdtaR
MTEGAQPPSQPSTNSTKPSRVIIVDDVAIIRLELREMLSGLGYQVIGEAADAPTAIELARRLRPDLVVMDIKMTPDMDGISAAEILTGERLAPVVLLTAYSQADLIERAKQAGVAGYVVKPFSESDLLPAIEIALARYQELRSLESEVAGLKDLLETRKVIERAKGVLMDTHNLREAEAFSRMRRLSMNSRRSMREVAEAILLAYEAGRG